MRKFSANIIVLNRGNDTTCTVNLHGATVVSWIINGEEQLFVSKLAVFNGRAPIRGGVTVTFPHYGSWAFGPRHGFSRIISWTVDKAPHKLKSGDIEAVFSLCESEFTKSMWNYQFRLVYTLVLHERELHFTVAVHNTNKELTFRFALALNHFLLFPDVTKCEVSGIEGCVYIDCKGEEEEIKKMEDVVKINALTDIIILDTPNEFYIKNTGSGRKFRIQKQNFSEILIWNPWSEQVTTISDISDDEYKKLLFFAAGSIQKSTALEPGGTFEAKVILCNCKTSFSNVSIF